MYSQVIKILFYLQDNSVRVVGYFVLYTDISNFQHIFIDVKTILPSSVTELSEFNSFAVRLIEI